MMYWIVEDKVIGEGLKVGNKKQQLSPGTLTIKDKTGNVIVNAKVGSATVSLKDMVVKNYRGPVSFNRRKFEISGGGRFKWK